MRSLRARIIAYLVLIHLVMAGISILVIRQNRLLLLAIEALFVLSIVFGILLVRSFFVPLELIRTGAELMSERDFTSQFREVGQLEMDALIRIYNQMIERLRDERLKAQEQHYFLDRILTASPAGILTLDYDGRIDHVNPSARELLGITGDEEIGKRLAEIEGLGEELAAIPVGESRMLSHGRRRLKASRAEFFDRGFPRSFLVIEELTEELRASEKAAYGKLVRMMSHEVNNSVGPVRSLLDSFRGYSAQLAEDDRQDFTQAVAVAIARLERLGAFVNGFAEVVRLPPPEKRPCDVRQLLDEIVLLLRPELDRRSIRCEWETPKGTVPLIDLDRNQIEQVLVNVLKNAMEAIGERGRITLWLRMEGESEQGRPVLRIADNGPGIPEEVRPLLFTPFFSTKRDGRGLGLTLTQEILAQHGFDFSLDNRPDGGAELWVGF